MEAKIKDWSILTKEQREKLMGMADSLGIPPQYVSHMYEYGMIAAPWEIDY